MFFAVGPEVVAVRPSTSDSPRMSRYAGRISGCVRNFLPMVSSLSST